MRVFDIRLDVLALTFIAMIIASLAFDATSMPTLMSGLCISILAGYITTRASDYFAIKNSKSRLAHYIAKSLDELSPASTHENPPSPENVALVKASATALLSNYTRGTTPGEQEILDDQESAAGYIVDKIEAMYSSAPSIAEHGRDIRGSVRMPSENCRHNLSKFIANLDRARDMYIDLLRKTREGHYSEIPESRFLNAFTLVQLCVFDAISVYEECAETKVFTERERASLNRRMQANVLRARHTGNTTE